MTASQYRAAIIGAGQGGRPLAVALAEAGWKTAIIERKYVGGTCVNVGCTPTKTMIASARVAYLARRSGDYGIHHGAVTVNLKEVRARKQKLVDRMRIGGEKQLEETKNLDLIMGEARFVDVNTLEIALNEGGRQQITAEMIFIDTGARPATLNIPGLDAVPTLDSTSIMELDDVPEHLIIVGGSYIGLEFGQMFCRFGSKVTIVETADQLVSHEDADVAEEVANILREDGIEILLNAEAQRADYGADKQVQLQVKTPEGTRVILGSHLLIGAGRVPNTDRLNLEAAGVKVDDKGYIQVNKHLETDVNGIYAIGDVKGGPAFTHISFDDFRILRANLLEGGNRTTGQRIIPYTMFIDPQLGRVGMSEKEAREAGYKVRVAKLPMSKVARAQETDETRGLMKAVVDADTDRILGAAILGIEGGEIASIIQVAMMGKLPYTALQDGVFSHPTLAESLNNLFTTLGE